MMHLGNKKKPVLLDTSSAILLYKAGIIDEFLSSYWVKITEAVYVELSRDGYEGSERFFAFMEKGGIHLLENNGDREENTFLQHLDKGERETIFAYFHGQGDFIVIDDKKGAQFLRNHKIPYINALLVPRLLFLGNKITAGQFRKANAYLTTNGRYAIWVREYAETCPEEVLVPFLPA